MQDRPYQTQAKAAVRSAYLKGTCRQLLSMATGTGKTIVFSQLATELKDILPGQTLIKAHREELIDQSIDKMRSVNPYLKISKEMAEHEADPNADVVVASVATLGRKGTKRLDKFNWANFDKIITDEAHHSTASTYMNIYEAIGVLQPNSKKLLLGVTATPNRADGEALAKVYQDIVFTYTLRQAIEDGWLVDVKCVRVNTRTNLDNVKTSMGDFQATSLADAVNNPVRNQLVVKAWLDNADNRQTVAFTVNIQHAQDLADMFRHYGVKAEAVWGDDPLRAVKLQQHKNEEITILVNCGVLTEGYDDWRIGCIVLARPTKSSGLFCLDLETEVLTPDGFKKYNQVFAGDTVAAFNQKDESIHWVVAKNKIERDLLPDEYMMSVVSPSKNIRVSNKHDLIYSRRITRKREKSAWLKNTAESLLGKDIILPIAGVEYSPGANLTDDELRFIGLFLSDGNINKTGAISISQSYHQISNRTYIEKVLDSCGFDYTYKAVGGKTQFKETSPRGRYAIRRGREKISKKRDPLGVSRLDMYLDKSFPKELETVTPYQLSLVLEGFHVGDGKKQLGQSWTRRSYHLCMENNLIMADKLQSLCIRKGFKCNLSTERYNKSLCYTLHIKNRNWTDFSQANNDGRPRFKKEEFKPETVWCLENSLGSLITRRQGIVTILGNCQMVGRGTRLQDGTGNLLDLPKDLQVKRDCVILDVVDSSYKHSLVTVPTLLGMGSRLDLNGQSLVGAIQKLEAAQKEYSHIDFSSLSDIDSLQSYIQKVNLFEFKFPSEVESNSELSWHNSVDGGYIMLLPDKDHKESIKIEQNLLDKYEMYGTINGKRYRGVRDTVEEAFQAADKLVRTEASNYLNLLKREAKWKQDTATPAQLKTLMKFYKGKQLPVSLTKGQASDLISKYLAGRN